MSMKRKYCVNCKWYNEPTRSYLIASIYEQCRRPDGDRIDIVSGEKLFHFLDARKERKLGTSNGTRCGLGGAYFEPLPVPEPTIEDTVVDPEAVEPDNANHWFWGRTRWWAVR